jgi:hypothetical protein
MSSTTCGGYLSTKPPLIHIITSSVKVPQYRNNKLDNRHTFLRVPTTLEEVEKQMFRARVDIEIASVDTNRVVKLVRYGESHNGGIWISMESENIEFVEDSHLLYCGVAKMALLHANAVIGEARVGEGCKSF